MLRGVVLQCQVSRRVEPRCVRRLQECKWLVLEELTLESIDRLVV